MWNTNSLALVKTGTRTCTIVNCNLYFREIGPWCRQFTAGWQHVHDEECSGRPSIITVEFVQKHWRIIISQLWNSAVISCIFPTPCYIKLSQSTCYSEICAASGCQSKWHQYTNQSTWSQHWHFCSGTMMMATSFWAGSSKVIKCGLHTLLQKPSSSQYIGVTVDLPARRNSSRLCQRRKSCAQCSGTGGAFSSSTSWSEVRW